MKGLPLTEEQRKNMVAWVEALESGQYEQTRNCLRDREGFCCLGVACDLFAKTTSTNWISRVNDDEDEPPYFEYEFLGKEGGLPEPVVEWLGILDDEGHLPEMTRDVYSLVDLNDMVSLTFPQIAAVIREQFLGEEPK